MVRDLNDGRYGYDGMKNCPFCGKPVGIEYIPSRKLFRVAHEFVEPDCPMWQGLTFAVDGIQSFRSAIDKWNRRAE